MQEVEQGQMFAGFSEREHCSCWPPSNNLYRKPGGRTFCSSVGFAYTHQDHSFNRILNPWPIHCAADLRSLYTYTVGTEASPTALSPVLLHANYTSY